MMEPTSLHVVATAGHVDHGKSSLIVRLTGIDPDRWAEEKRRGLTIDLGFAWTILPSGREIGFVDVPGHERFVRNMLAGVGPVRLVLFVVAADEGWKPQSEEHLQIVDVLGTDGAVVALTKSDLVDPATAAARALDIRERLAGTALEGAQIVACSSATGEGMDDLREALDVMLDAAPNAEDLGRPRIWVDRAFTIHGTGTVVTGTLTGGTLSVGQEVTLQPEGTAARIRSLQTHRRPVEVARPVSRVAANLAGLPKQAVQRGDALVLPGQWRPTARIEVRLRPVRRLAHTLTARGAYKLHAGSAERDARVRLYGMRELHAGGTAYAHLRLSRPLTLGPGDRFVLREAGRRETVAGGLVLDADPPPRPGPDPAVRLARREGARGEALASLLLEERGAVRASELSLLSDGAGRVPGAERVGRWWVAGSALDRLEAAALEALASYHRTHPLRAGPDASEVHRAVRAAAGSAPLAAALEQDLSASVMERLETAGRLAREGTVVRLATHRISLGALEEEAGRLVAAVATGEPTPPTISDLASSGFPRDLIEAACATGRLVRISTDIVVTPSFAGRAEEIARTEAPGGLTVSRFRELLETSRKYALPLLAWLDERGVTRRDGDVRRPGNG